MHHLTPNAPPALTSPPLWQAKAEDPMPLSTSVSPVLQSPGTPLPQDPQQRDSPGSADQAQCITPSCDSMATLIRSGLELSDMGCNMAFGSVCSQLPSARLLPATPPQQRRTPRWWTNSSMIRLARGIWPAFSPFTPAHT